MALLGKIEQYDPEQEEWPQYVERLEQFFEANDLTAGRRKSGRETGYFPLGHRTSALQTVEKPPYSCETKREKVR